ncbi:hypothetical protein [Pelagicoccus sp. SDUM812003]|uniref:hypothetical protein n=1 Tax=Pelagicoccus sp. SDUM812003 TaxID=3041267 RepID=UPI00280E5C57|nr:hypothetical protein [Pelagicoccus sp. SDUM812003]MDQ8203568.1 hypothetical protein [Pelagicoccus sp. SDUM812003]
MSIDELIAVNSLLIERETELAELSQIERSITELLGQPYPFDAPQAELPSSHKRKLAKAKKRPTKKGPPKIRRLKDDEFAYRVTLSENGEIKTHDLLDFAPFQDLLAKPLPHLRIHKVETIDVSQSPVDLLFEA